MELVEKAKNGDIEAFGEVIENIMTLLQKTKVKEKL